MSETVSETDDVPPSKGKKGLVLVGLIALLGAGGSFAAVWAGLLDSVLPRGESELATTANTAIAADVDPDLGLQHSSKPGATAFHALEPLAVSIGTGGSSRQIRIRIVLEVPAGAAATTADRDPLLLDGLLGYLRAVDHRMLEDPTALILMRAQMLRRARLILGEDKVDNLLVTDFVLN